MRAADTVGLRVPVWAAPPPTTADGELVPAWWPGTINIIVSVPVPLDDAAYVNPVMAGTECPLRRQRAGMRRSRRGAVAWLQSADKTISHPVLPLEDIF